MNGLFGDDDDDDEEGGGRRKRAKREYGAEGDLDELDFEETFADDEEKPDVEAEDEEEKEMEVRLEVPQSMICFSSLAYDHSGTAEARIQIRQQDARRIHR